MVKQISFKHHQLNISYLGFGVGSLLLCALTLFMCASHSRRPWRRWKACYGYGNPEPVIELSTAEFIDYELGNVDLTACSGEGTLWKKNILMGGKCQLPDFSGVIMYDSKGNVVNPNENQRALPALTWK